MSIPEQKNQKKFPVSILTDDPSGAIMWTTKGAVNRRLALVNSYPKKQLHLGLAVAFLFVFFCDIPYQPDQCNDSIDHGGTGSQKLEQKAMSFL